MRFKFAQWYESPNPFSVSDNVRTGKGGPT